MAQINVGIIGVSGLVGQAILDSIKRLNFIDKLNLYLFGTTEKLIQFNSKEYPVKIYDNSIFETYKLAYVILAVDNNSAREIIKFTKESNSKTIIIDNSSEFRMCKTVPLCVPEINYSDIKPSDKIIANPNCSTTILCMLLKPLLNICSIKKIIVSTYQASSGAGYRGLEELKKQTKEISEGEPLTIDYWKKQYVHNIFSHNSAINTDNLFNEEELKMINETKKILKINPKISTTCVRVPTLRAHCLSVHIEFTNDITKEQILCELNKFSGIQIHDFIELNEFPEPVKSENSTDIYVGRIRSDLDDKSCWNFFISGDQLLKGAGYNSVQILQKLLLLS